MDDFEAISEQSMSWLVGRLNYQHGIDHLADSFHPGTLSARRVNDYVVELEMTGEWLVRRDVHVSLFVADIYEVSEADVEDILAQFPGVRIILTWSPWHSCTDAAVARGRARGVHVMRAIDFLGRDAAVEDFLAGIAS